MCCSVMLEGDDILRDSTAFLAIPLPKDIEFNERDG